MKVGKNRRFRFEGTIFFTFKFKFDELLMFQNWGNRGFHCPLLNPIFGIQNLSGFFPSSFFGGANYWAAELTTWSA